jgi:hypothetical protein
LARNAARVAAFALVARDPARRTPGNLLFVILANAAALQRRFELHKRR